MRSRHRRSTSTGGNHTGLIWIVERRCTNSKRKKKLFNNSLIKLKSSSFRNNLLRSKKGKVIILMIKLGGPMLAISMIGQNVNTPTWWLIFLKRLANYVEEPTNYLMLSLSTIKHTIRSLLSSTTMERKITWQVIWTMHKLIRSVPSIPFPLDWAAFFWWGPVLNKRSQFLFGSIPEIFSVSVMLWSHERRRPKSLSWSS